MQLIRNSAWVFVLAILALPMAACNTVEGAGEDVEAAGDAISDTARDVRD